MSASHVEPSALMNRPRLAVSKVTATAITQAATRPPTVSTRLGSSSSPMTCVTGLNWV